MRKGQYYLIKYYDNIVAVKLTEKYTCNEWKGWGIKPNIPEIGNVEYGELGGTLVAINEKSPPINENQPRKTQYNGRGIFNIFNHHTKFWPALSTKIQIFY